MLLQSLHFNSVLIDPFGNQGDAHINEEATNWESTSACLYESVAGRTYRAYHVWYAMLSKQQPRTVALRDKDGKFLGQLHDRKSTTTGKKKSYQMFRR